MSSKSLVSLVASSLSLSLFACGAAPTEAQGTSGQAVSAATVDPAFTPCAFDSDCIAVPQAGCCNNGWRAAVNADLVCAYDDANTCTAPNAICPQYVVNDTRVALCSNESLSCEMVAPTSIHCGGDGTNPHSCPTGYDCIVASDDAATGTCAPHVDSSNDDAGTSTSN